MEGSFTFGPELKRNAVLFRLWAPLAESVRLRIETRGEWIMPATENGWKLIEVPDVKPGDRYSFILPDGHAVPDPASRYQPDDVHGPSELIDPAFEWQTTSWRGRPWEEIVIYELHVGAFTQAGTFRSAIERLDHLQRLGVTAVQLMPLADFRGLRGWGYDGVLPYAPDSSYGRPQELKMFVDAAHARGLCVFLDVVYNHFGPDGNYLPAYAQIFSERHENSWGPGLNFDGKGSRFVRDFVIENAIYWLREFRMDGLRLDAAHAIRDDSTPHILTELADRARRAIPERPIHLILENEDNNAGLLARDDAGRPLHFTAQWNDDIHHALHVAATGETFGYYGDYADCRACLRRSLAEGFSFQGEPMAYRGGVRGSPSGHLPPTAFISFIQNHDQIGNRAKGDRMLVSHPREAMKAIAAIYLLAPEIPMLFMGEEWGSIDPFPFFCDFDEALNDKVRIGRRQELKRLPGFDDADALDPTLEATFFGAKLDWSNARQDEEIVDHYRRLIALRQSQIIPILGLARNPASIHHDDSRLVRVSWQLDQAILCLTANLSSETIVTAMPDLDHAFLVLGSASSDRIGPWSVVWQRSPDITVRRQ